MSVRPEVAPTLFWNGGVSWFRTHLDKSLTLIERAVDQRSASIIDVGGGESTLVDDLIDCHRHGPPVPPHRTPQKHNSFVERKYR